MWRIKICGIFVLTWATLTSGINTSGALIRPLEVYKDIVNNVHDYFDNTCIIFMHTTTNSVSAEDLRESKGLLAIQKYFSSSLHIRTAIMDIETFHKRIGLKYYNIKRPLFVLLNDSEEVKNQFANQVSSWISMAYPTWLAFFRNETTMEEFFVDIYVPFDCTFIITKPYGNGEILTEVYQIDRDKELRSMIFGVWDKTRGLKGPNVGLYQRRSDLHGQEIRVTAMEDPPISYIVQDANGQVTGIKGTFGALLTLLQKQMNCTFVYNVSRKWSDVITFLQNNEADIGVNELMMTSDRMDVIEFTTPVFTTKCRIFIKTPSSTAVKWGAYMAPFHIGIWHCLGFLIVVTSVTISLIKATVRIVLSCLKDIESSPSRFTEIAFYVFGAFCNQGMPYSLLDPVRLVHLAIHLTAVVVLAAYSAALISFLAVKTVIMPFTTAEGLLKDGTYRFSTIDDSADYNFFKNTTDKTMKLLYTELLSKETDLPVNYLEGLRRLCDEKNYAFMMMDNTAAIMRNLVDCTYEALDTVTQSSIAMAVRHGLPYRGIIDHKIEPFIFMAVRHGLPYRGIIDHKIEPFIFMAVRHGLPYRGIIDHNILLVRDTGVLRHLLQAEWSYDGKKQMSRWMSVEINDVFPLLLFMYGGLTTSLLLLCLERSIFEKCLRRRELRRRNLRKKQLKQRIVAPVS